MGDEEQRLGSFDRFTARREEQENLGDLRCNQDQEISLVCNPARII